MKLSFAFREARRSYVFSSFFILFLSLGLLGFVFLEGAKESIERSLSARSQALLAGDLRVSARRSLSTQEQSSIDRHTKAAKEKTNLVSLYSMLSHQSKSRLVRIKAIEGNYPLYGQVVLEKQGLANSESLQSAQQIWMDPELRLQLRVEQGDKVQLGETSFVVAGFIEDDSSISFRGGGLAPKAYIGASFLDATKLVKKGSTVTYIQLFRFSEDVVLEDIKNRMNADFEEPGIRVRTHEKVTDQIGRFLGYFKDYLSLVSLVALLLASLGAVFHYRAFLMARIREMAILKMLGSTSKKLLSSYMSLLIFFGTLASLISIVGAWTLLSVSEGFIEDLMKVDLEFSFPTAAALMALVFGPVIAWASCWPLLSILSGVQANLLFRESFEEMKFKSKAVILRYIPCLVIFGALSVWQANSIKIGLYFFGAILLSLAMVSGLGRVFFHLLNRISKTSGAGTKIALREIARHRIGSLAILATLCLGTALISLIVQIEHSLEKELSLKDASTLPSLFLFDIQPEQLEGLESVLAKQGARIRKENPFIRARLLQINDQKFERRVKERAFQTREQDWQNWVRNRRFNISYQAALSDSEEIVAGRAFSPPEARSGDAPAELSVERRFANRLGLELGDRLEFEIQGVPFVGKVVNFRKVRWASFDPNFFIVTHPGVLEGAPKTHIASVQSLSFKKKVEVQEKVVEAFPNISVIDVERTISKIYDLFKKLAGALKLMGLFCLLVGLSVLNSIVYQKTRERVRDVALLKVLGCRLGTLRRMIGIEFGILGGFAALLGVVVGFLVFLPISKEFFEASFDYSVYVAAFLLLMVTGLSLLISILISEIYLQKKSLNLIQMGAS